MGIFITNNIEQECLNLISMYTDLGYVKKKILSAYPGLSSSKQSSVAKKIKSHIEQGNSFLERTTDNILTVPLTIFYSLQNYVKAIYLVNYPNLSLAGSHGIDFDNDVAEDATEIGEIKCKMCRKGTFGNLVTLTGDAISADDSFVLKDIFSVIPELRETYYLRYCEEPNVFLLRHKKYCTSEFDIVLQDDNLEEIRAKDFSILDSNHIHIEFRDRTAYIWKDSNYLENNNIIINDVFGNLYCTNGIFINQRFVKISRIVCLYLCYYAFSMLVRYYPERWHIFCESSDVAIIRKLLINCRREMLVEVIQLLTGINYSFTTVVEETDEVLDANKIFKLVKEEAKKEYIKTGKNALIFN